MVLGTPRGQHLRTTERATRQNKRKIFPWHLLRPSRCCAARSLAVFYDAAGVRGLSVLPRPPSAISRVCVLEHTVQSVQTSRLAKGGVDAALSRGSLEHHDADMVAAVMFLATGPTGGTPAAQPPPPNRPRQPASKRQCMRPARTLSRWLSLARGGRSRADAAGHQLAHIARNHTQ
jgi:hypothetical protein